VTEVTTVASPTIPMPQLMEGEEEVVAEAAVGEEEAEAINAAAEMVAEVAVAVEAEAAAIVAANKFAFNSRKATAQEVTAASLLMKLEETVVEDEEADAVEAGVAVGAEAEVTEVVGVEVEVAAAAELVSPSKRASVPGEIAVDILIKVVGYSII